MAKQIDEQPRHAPASRTALGLQFAHQFLTTTQRQATWGNQTQIQVTGSVSPLGVKLDG
jgi:hypothetical protein